MRTDWLTIECEETFDFCLFVDVSFSSRINHRPRAACRVFKADVLRESKKIDMEPWQWDRRSKLAAVSYRSRTARQCSTWERGKIGRRRRIHTEMTKRITHNWHTNPNSHEHESESQSEVDHRTSTFGEPPPIDNVCVDSVPVYMHIQLGTVKLSRWRHWLNFIEPNGAAPRAAKSALQRSRLYRQLHQLWKSFELHERSKLDELARAVMTGRVLIAIFTTFSFQSFLCFIGSFAQPRTLTQLSRTLNTSIKQRLVEDTTTL